MTKGGAAKAGKFQTKNALLQAAKELFANLGFDGVTVSAICKRAGISGTQVHYHFRDKVHLYRSLLELCGEGEIARISKLLTPVESAVEFRLRLELFVTEYLVWHSRDELTFRILTFEYLRGMPIARDIFEKKFSILRQQLQHYLEAAKSAGLIRSDVDVEIVTSALFGALNSLHDYMKFGKRASTVDDGENVRIAKEFVNTVISGLRVESQEEHHGSSL